MTNLHYIIVVLIILSASIFLGAFSYHQKLIDREPVLAKKISSVTSVLVSSSELTKSEPQLVSDARGVTEEKAIKWSIYFSVSLLIITISLIAFEKIKIVKKTCRCRFSRLQ